MTDILIQNQTKKTQVNTHTHNRHENCINITIILNEKKKKLDSLQNAPNFFKSTLTLAEKKRLQWQQERG